MTWCLFELEDNMTAGIFVKYEVTLNFKNEFEPCPQIKMKVLVPLWSPFQNFPLSSPTILFGSPPSLRAS